MLLRSGHGFPASEGLVGMQTAWLRWRADACFRFQLLPPQLRSLPVSQGLRLSQTGAFSCCFVLFLLLCRPDTVVCFVLPCVFSKGAFDRSSSCHDVTNLGKAKSVHYFDTSAERTLYCHSMIIPCDTPLLRSTEKKKYRIEH